jgi:hypothetical protein
MGDKKRESIKLDQIMKVLFKLSKKVMINLMNGLFDENFISDEVTIEYGNSEFIEDNFDRIVGDIFITIRRKNQTYKYHIEFQTTNDNSMVIRMFRYGFEKAHEIYNGEKCDKIRLEFPKQLVIFIEENENIVDELSFEMVLPDGKEILYKVPTMKYWQFTVENLQKKKMYALLPLQVFKSRKKIENIYQSKKEHSEKAQLIKEEFDKLLDTMKLTINALRELDEKNEIIISDLEKILKVIININEYLYNRYGEYIKIDEEVYNMVKSLFDPAARKQALIEGEKKGKKKVK